MQKTGSKFAAFMYVALVFAGSTLLAQEAKPHSSKDVYKIDYVFSELLDNKKVNARSYTVLVAASEKASLRLGSRIPVATGAFGTNSKEGTPAVPMPTQFTYMDIGVSIDCTVDALDPDVGLHTNVDISRLAPENRIGQPIVRNTRISVHNVLPLGKLTVLTSADEVDTTGRFQIEATVSKVK